jgi:hypothetical protein
MAFEEHKIKRADYPEEQCQHIIPSKGQCRNRKEEHSDYCLAHGGNRAGEKVTADSLRNYQLTKWHAKVHRFTESNHIKSLRDEIGIMRMVLEEQLERCSEPVDLIISQGRIGNMIQQIEKLVTSCHKLETNLGETLDKTALANFAGQIIQIISRIVVDDKQLEEISVEIAKLFMEDKKE